jgi:hypothetical protein
MVVTAIIDVRLLWGFFHRPRPARVPVPEVAS